MTERRLQGLQGVVTSNATDKHRRKLEGVARTFQHDERYERLLTLRDEDSAAFEQVPRLVRWSLAHYETARKAAIEVGTYKPGGGS
ncbi:MAG: hypothetical protein ACRDJV_04830 [Actinomycetota bacterium]